MSSEDLAKKKYDRALELIERAQNLLADACAELSPLIGAVDQFELVSKHHDSTKQLWRTIAYSYVRTEVRIDTSTSEAKL